MTFPQRRRRGTRPRSRGRDGRACEAGSGNWPPVLDELERQHRPEPAHLAHRVDARGDAVERLLIRSPSSRARC